MHHTSKKNEIFQVEKIQIYYRTEEIFFLNSLLIQRIRSQPMGLLLLNLSIKTRPAWAGFKTAEILPSSQLACLALY